MNVVSEKKTSFKTYSDKETSFSNAEVSITLYKQVLSVQFSPFNSSYNSSSEPWNTAISLDEGNLRGNKYTVAPLGVFISNPQL